MKKIIHVLFIISILLFFKKICFASNEFVPLENSLNFKSDYSDQNEQRYYQPDVIYDNSTYKMWYTSYDGNLFRIAYATSDDGLSWHKNSLLNVNNDIHAHDPSMLKIANNYFLYFASYQNGLISLKRISSNDGVNFDNATLKNILTASGGWEGNSISCPDIVYKNGQYYLFYSGNGSSLWNTGLATSNNGIDWQRCPNNPILPNTASPFLFQTNNKYLLFFQSPAGMEVVESTDPLSCNMTWTNRHLILDSGREPSVIQKGDELFLYYSKSYNNRIQIDLATTTHYKNYPIIFIPGFFGSWNKEAILHNEKVSNDDWILNPIVHEYDGITKTLNNLGYVNNNNFYIFNYDWRKNIENIVTDLDSFLKNKISDNKQINIIGHSLGGIIGRIYSQKYDQKIKHLITAGSPHKGTIQSYKAVEAGEIETDDPLMWLGEKFVLKINTHNLKTDRQIVNEMLPIGKDLLPISDFLKDENGNNIQINNMQVKNDYLFANQNVDNINSFAQSLFGTKTDTISGYRIIPRNIFDQIFDNYPDGYPVEKYYQTGDQVVTGDNAKVFNNNQSFPFDHGEIVYRKEAISNILDSLQIPYSNNQVVSGRKTEIFPSLVFLILSPATLTVKGNGQTFSEQAGMVLIENAFAGEYIIEAQGKEKGKYTILIGQITADHDLWTKVSGEIINDQPTQQVDVFKIKFDPTLPSSLQFTNLTPLYNDLLLTTTELNNDELNSLSKQAMSDFINTNLVNDKILMTIQQQVFQLLVNDNNDENCNRLFEVLSKSEMLYGYSQKETQKDNLKQKLDSLQDQIESLKKYLVDQKNAGKNITPLTKIFNQIKEKNRQAYLALDMNQLNYCETLTRSIERLIKLIPISNSDNNNTNNIIVSNSASTNNDKNNSSNNIDQQTNPISALISKIFPFYSENSHDKETILGIATNEAKVSKSSFKKPSNHLTQQHSVLIDTGKYLIIMVIIATIASLSYIKWIRRKD